MTSNNVKIALENIEIALIGCDIDDASELLVNQFGAEVWDEDFDNPGDNPGEYVMKRCLSIGSQDIRLYYLNTERVVADVVATNP